MAAKRNDKEYLPEELITEVLVRLPVKSLLRFKAVSHPWLSQISSPTFIHSHLRRSITVRDHNLILNKDKRSIAAIRLNSDTDVDLDLPISKGEIRFLPHLELIGSHNGIVCAAVRPGSTWLYPCIYLWNPATKQSKLINPPSPLRINIEFDRYAFGFDSIANDFKLVRFVTIDTFAQGPPYAHQPCEYTAQLYSANNNVWTRVESPPLGYPYNYFVNVKGVLYCQGVSGSLMTFDWNKEVFNNINLPIVRSYIPRVIEFKGSITLIDYKHSKIALWRLDDACLLGGTQGSWAHMFTVDVGFGIDYCKNLYFNSGDILLTTGGSYKDYYLFNLDNKELKPVQIPTHRDIFKYAESLVSVPGFKQVRLNAHADDN